MFHYYGSIGELEGERSSAHVAVAPEGLTDERELVAALGGALGFPWYAGNNLDAFWDCVRDLAWLERRRVILAHRDLPNLPGSRLSAYVEVLRDGVDYWEKPGSPHRLDVWFPETARERAEETLRALKP